MSQPHFSHRTQQKNTQEIYSIIPESKQQLEQVLKSNEFKEDASQFYYDMVDAKNVSIVDHQDDNQIIIKYRKYGLHALAKRNMNSKNNNDLILIHFYPKEWNPLKSQKHKKSNYHKTASNDILRAYIPMTTNIRTGVNRVQGYINVGRNITEAIIPLRIMKTHIVDIYQYMDKMICLQQNIVINEKIWILCFNYHCKDTGEQIYMVAMKITDPENNRNFVWRLRDMLYTAQDIYKKFKIPKETLPTTMLASDEHSLKMQNVIMIQRILSNPHHRSEIFRNCKKNPWTKVAIFVNENLKNKEERKLGIRKENFLKACRDEANISDNFMVLPMLLFTETGYSIDGLWRVRIHDGLDVAISFTLSTSSKNTTCTIIPTGIHMSRNEMMIHCQMINSQQTIGTFFDAWVSKYNNLAVGDPNSQMAQYKRKVKEWELLRDKNMQYESVIDQLKVLNNPTVNHILDSLNYGQEQKTEEKYNTINSDEKSREIVIETADSSHSKLNPTAAIFVADEKCKTSYFIHKMDCKLYVPEIKETKEFQ